MNKKIFIILGAIIAVLFLICGGMSLKNHFDKKEEMRIQEEKRQLEEAREKAKEEQAQVIKEREEKIADLKKQSEELKTRKIDLNAEESAEFRRNGFSKRYYELQSELKDVGSELSKIESEIRTLERKNSEEVNLDLEFDFDYEEDESSFNFIFVIPIIIFVVAFIIIISTFVMSARGVNQIISGAARRDMLNDLSDVAVKMAKDLNPTYKEFKCPNCGAALDSENTEIKNCGYCGAKLYKTADMSGHHKNRTHKK